MEMDKDGFISDSEPLKIFIRTGAAHLSANEKHKCIGYVKGMARVATSLAPVLFCLQYYKNIKELLPTFVQSMHVIHVQIEVHSTMTAVALRNAVLSARGSIREAHCSIVWTMKLTYIYIRYG